MPAFHAHHCPVCGRIGDKRCIAIEHYVECEIHPNSFHSKHSDCVKCAGALRREAQRESKERNKENEQPVLGKRDKKVKKIKVKPTHEKTIKQLRREKREARRLEAHAVGTEECLRSLDGSEEWDEAVGL